MAESDDLQELLKLAQQALQCQADLGHKEIILEAMDHTAKKTPTPLVLEPAQRRPEPLGFFTPSDESTSTVAAEYENIDQHQKAICNCLKCPLGHTRTKFVYGVGSPTAKIMFVGEAPGRDEDLKGEPFVGRAGQLLDKILAAMKLNRQDVYIANILKCRPPENRDPQPDEMQTCLPYLREQIRLIKPQFLCCLGRIAAHGLLNTTTPLGKMRGQWHSFEGIPVLVTYHPAALLRFPQYKPDVWKDMQFLMAEYERRNQNG